MAADTVVYAEMFAAVRAFRARVRGPLLVVMAADIDHAIKAEERARYEKAVACGSPIIELDLSKLSLDHPSHIDFVTDRRVPPGSYYIAGRQ